MTAAAVLHRLPLQRAHVIDQPNRFTVRVQLAGRPDPDRGPTVSAYLSNTGNLRSILRPGAEVMIAAAGDSGHRKLHHDLVLARQWGHWVAVDAGLSSRLVAEALASHRLPGFEGWHLERREPRVAGGRLDLLLRRGARHLWMEVKCTTLVRNGLARFPNPATKRGTHHLNLLREIARQGGEAAICFVAQRPDAHAFRTLVGVDPAFAAALAEARAVGVRCHAYRCHVTQRGAWLREEVPVLG